MTARVISSSFLSLRIIIRWRHNYPQTAFSDLALAAHTDLTWIFVESLFIVTKSAAQALIISLLVVFISFALYNLAGGRLGGGF